MNIFTRFFYIIFIGLFLSRANADLYIPQMICPEDKEGWLVGQLDNQSYWTTQDEARAAGERYAERMAQFGPRKDCKVNDIFVGSTPESSFVSLSKITNEAYSEVVIKAVKPYIVFDSSREVGNPSVTIQIKIALDGAVLDRKILSPSKSTEWDMAALKAWNSVTHLPKNDSGLVPQETLRIVMSPKSNHELVEIEAKKQSDLAKQKEAQEQGKAAKGLVSGQTNNNFIDEDNQYWTSVADEYVFKGSPTCQSILASDSGAMLKTFIQYKNSNLKAITVVPRKSPARVNLAAPGMSNILALDHKIYINNYVNVLQNGNALTVTYTTGNSSAKLSDSYVYEPSKNIRYFVALQPSNPSLQLSIDQAKKKGLPGAKEVRCSGPL